MGVETKRQPVWKGKHMRVLDGLEPKKVFYYFEEICGIPHPSYQEKRISDYLVDFARSHGLEWYQDALYNVIMIAPATAGYEDEEPLILQGHMDMVCEKAPDTDIDFETEGLRLRVDGDYVSAQGTTLGGDDGIALAYMLAILDSDDIAHPRLEIVCTVSEEVGMEGATGIDLSALRGHKLINIDSEEEGVLTVGCAGGNSTICHVPMEYQPVHAAAVEVRVGGMKGGHSGVEIDKGRANANCVLGRLLLVAEQSGLTFTIASLGGGAKQNAIPREATAVLVCAPEQVQALCTSLEDTMAELRHEYAVTDGALSMELAVRSEAERNGLTEASARTVTLLLNLLPNGVQRMSADIEGLVETSLNLGIMALDERELRLEFSVRSSVVSARDALTARIVKLTETVGGTVEVQGVYPAWEYRADSVLRSDAVRLYEEMYGNKPTVETIHAGLECGILAGKLRDLDGISIGPDMTGIHTFEEKLSISSTQRVYAYLLELLKCRHDQAAEP